MPSEQKVSFRKTEISGKVVKKRFNLKEHPLNIVKNDFVRIVCLPFDCCLSFGQLSTGDINIL